MKAGQPSIDLFALRRDKEMSPGARLDWLAAALEFVRMTEGKTPRKRGDERMAEKKRPV